MKKALTVLLLAGGLALAQADGAKIYAQCAGCHQANGQGIPGAFPPLAGHVAEILSKAGGREYLIKVLLWRRQGQAQEEEGEHPHGHSHIHRPGTPEDICTLPG